MVVFLNLNGKMYHQYADNALFFPNPIDLFTVLDFKIFVNECKCIIYVLLYKH